MNEKKRSKAEVLRNPNDKELVRAEVLDYAEAIEAKNRKNWKDKTDLASLQDKTIIEPTRFFNGPNFVSPRKAWDEPHRTVINALADADISPGSTNNEATLKAENQAELIPAQQQQQKTGLKRGQTFLIKKNEAKDFVKNVLDPEKIATLKATLLTIGRFDMKITNVS